MNYENELKGIADGLDMPVYNDVPENSSDFLVDMLNVNYEDTVYSIAGMLQDETGIAWNTAYSESSEFCAKYYLNRFNGVDIRFIDGVTLQLFVEYCAWSNLALDEALQLYRVHLQETEIVPSFVDDDDVLRNELFNAFVVYLSFGIDDGSIAGYLTETFQEEVS